MLNEAYEIKESEKVKLAQFCKLEEKYYLQDNIIEGLKSEND